MWQMSYVIVACAAPGRKLFSRPGGPCLSERLFDIEHLDADRVRHVADRLRTLGYTEDGVRERLGLDDISAVELDEYPYYINERLRRRDRLHAALLPPLLPGRAARRDPKPPL